jgi:hypothetical protein
MQNSLMKAFPSPLSLHFLNMKMEDDCLHWNNSPIHHFQCYPYLLYEMKFQLKIHFSLKHFIKLIIHLMIFEFLCFMLWSSYCSTLKNSLPLLSWLKKNQNLKGSSIEDSPLNRMDCCVWRRRKKHEMTFNEWGCFVLRMELLVCI